MSRRGRSLPATAGGFDTHRDSITVRWSQIVAETPTDVPNVPISVGGVTTTPNSTGLTDIRSFQAMYHLRDISMLIRTLD